MANISSSFFYMQKIYVSLLFSKRIVLTYSRYQTHKNGHLELCFKQFYFSFSCINILNSCTVSFSLIASLLAIDIILLKSIGEHCSSSYNGYGFLVTDSMVGTPPSDSLHIWEVYDPPICDLTSAAHLTVTLVCFLPGRWTHAHHISWNRFMVFSWIFHPTEFGRPASVTL